jgi:hypothetical protein
VPDFDRALQVLRDVASRCQRAYGNAHADHNTHPERLDYVILAAQALKKVDPGWGLNGKRGNASDPSADAIAYGVGRNVRIYDIITAAGEHGTNLNALGFNDVTAFGPGVYIDPDGWTPVAACSGQAPTPTPTEPPPQPKPTPVSIPGRSEMMEEGRALDDFYASEEGLQRKPEQVEDKHGNVVTFGGGLSINGRPDWEGIAAWLLDIYLMARVAGKSREESREMYREQIRNSAEWRNRHR